MDAKKIFNTVKSENNWLSAYKKNITSEFGEDGVIEKIFEIIPDSNGWCVEFGALDGLRCSNVWNLIKNKGWSGILIESSTNRYKKLLRAYHGCNNAVCINKRVNFEGENTLDNILSKTQIPRFFDLLSIDIDGNDFFIWQSTVVYKPKLVIIEFNPSIPTDVDFVQPKDMNINQGSSLLALYNLAKQKGYELVAATKCNAFFIDKTYFSLFNIQDNAPPSIFTDISNQTKIFQLYDGTLVLHGCKQLLWHSIEIKQQSIQVLPGLLIKYPPRFGPLLTTLFIGDFKTAFLLFLGTLRTFYHKVKKLMNFFKNGFQKLQY